MRDALIKKVKAMRLVSLLLLIFSIFLIQGCDKAGNSLVTSKHDEVTIFPKAITPSPFEFKNKQGQRVDNQVFLGQWNIVYFGYTYCPDVCPTALTDMRNLFKILDESERQKYKVWLVSVDPERDTPEVLKQFLHYFNPSFDALTGNEKALKQLASEMHAYFAKVKTSGEAPYLVDHSANLALVDSSGNYRGFIVPPHNPERIKAILKELEILRL